MTSATPRHSHPIQRQPIDEVSRIEVFRIGDAARDRSHRDAQLRSHAALAAGSKSFRLAARLLAPQVSNDAAVCYAWCRRADDLIDDTSDPAAGVRRLQAELAWVFSEPLGGREVDEFERDIVLSAFREVVQRRKIPRAYPAALIAGFAMDAMGACYRSLDDLELYCFRVAGVVGLMMTHVLGVHDPRCLPAAARLGMAMQLTNVSRDVLEDWQRGRIYIPSQLLYGDSAREHGDDASDDGDDRHRDSTLKIPAAGTTSLEPFRSPLAAAVRHLLERAARNYRAARDGFIDLPWRSALAIRVAALVYEDIGRELRRRDCDVSRGRAVVSTPRKAWLVFRATLASFAEIPMRIKNRSRRRRLGREDVQIPNCELRFPDDVLLGG